MEILPLVGIYRKGQHSPSPAEQRGALQKNEESDRMPEGPGKARPICILTIFDGSTSSALLEKWSRGGVRLLRPPEATPGAEEGIWVRLLPSTREDSPGHLLPLPDEPDSRPAEEQGLIASHTLTEPAQNTGIAAPSIPRARPHRGPNEGAGFPGYVARLYASGSVERNMPVLLSRYI